MGVKGFFSKFDDVWMVDGVRTPFVDYTGAFASISPIDLGILVAKSVLARTGIDPVDIGAVVTGSVAQASFDAYFAPRHIGLYSGVPVEVPALEVQRICGTGFELFRQAGDQIARGYADVVLCVGAESMSRNPIAAYTHRAGFKLGAPVEFKDFLWEALMDSAPGVSMIQTAENLAKRYRITRADVDAYAAASFARAVAAQAEGYFAGEIVPVVGDTFRLEGYVDRGIRLPRGTTRVDRDSHVRPSPLAALEALRPVYPGGVQTAGNSSAVVDGAGAAIVASGAYLRAREMRPLGRVVAAAVVGVPPEIMGIGPAPAIRLLLERSGVALADVGRFEINEAQGAQTLAVARELGLDHDKLNVNGGAIAIGHPLGATGVRLTLSVARELRRRGLRYGVSSACVGGGQGIALLIENCALD